MASSDLEEKINKIRLQNEEIKRRYEEVEADKKHAAKQNALVQMVPSDDWPERKEPPEFSAPAKNVQKQKTLNKEHSERLPQHYSSIQERFGKKDHKFTQGNGPPPDPKYNFLADSEREMHGGDDSRIDEEKSRTRNKAPRGGPRRKGGSGGGGSRDAFFKDNRGPQAFHSKEESLPEYEAWRAERNRIDEARINRQKTAEGNWRREWDCNKTNIEKDTSRKGDLNRKDSNTYERRNNHYDSDYSNRGHGGSRTYHGSQKNHSHQDYRRSHYEQSHEYKRQSDSKPPLSPTDDRSVTNTDKSIKVVVNPANQPKGPVMSVKVNSPSIAGTGRVGPRQKSRITYSSQSDAEGSNQEFNNFPKQKSFDDKTTGTNFNNGSKTSPKSPYMPRKKEGNSKSLYTTQKKEFRNDESSNRSKNSTKTMYSQNIESKDQRQANTSLKPQRNQKRVQKVVTEKLENVQTSNDEALPSEYQPEKLTNNVTDLIINNDGNNLENILNTQDQKTLINSTADATITNEFVCVNSIKNIDCENIEQNHDQKEIDLNNDNVVNEITQVSQNVDLNSINNEKEDKLPAILNLDEITQQNITQNILIEDDSKPVDLESIQSPKSGEKDEPKILNLENTIDSCLDSELEQKNLQQEMQIIVPAENVKESTLFIDQKDENICKIINDDVGQIKDQLNKDVELPETCNVDIQEKTSNCNQTDELKKSVNDDVQKINYELEKDSKLQPINNVQETNITKESIQLDENKIVDLVENSQNEFINDNEILHNIMSNTSNDLDETEIIETNSSPNTTANDSGFVDESNQVQINSQTFVSSNIVSDTDNIEKNISESVKSDFVNPTKEINNKTAEICDIHSAPTSEISEAVEDNTEKNEHSKEANVTLETSTKDSDVNNIEEVEKSLEPSKVSDMQNEIPLEKKNDEKKGSTTVAIEELSEN